MEAREVDSVVQKMERIVIGVYGFRKRYRKVYRRDVGSNSGRMTSKLSGKLNV